MDSITSYILNQIKEEDQFLKELSDRAAKEDSYIPIVTPDVLSLLKLMLSVTKPKRILEIGTGEGYSAIAMAKHVPCAHVATVERYEKRVCTARENIKQAQLTDRIQIMYGDASDLLPNMEETFDFIFLDGAKGQYPEMLPHLVRILNDNGILFSDNVLYKGMVASNDNVAKRKITIVKRLRKYIDMLNEHPLLETAVVPIGDGVAISRKGEKSYEM